MAKKSRRTRAKYQGRVTGVAGARPAQPGAVPAEAQLPHRSPSTAQDPASRYQHVIPDVKRIGIIAGAIVLVLIILSFILG
jgi:hypothetical protein